jgi:hypothetical protein
MKLLYNPISPFARMCLFTARELGLSSALEIIHIEGITTSVPNAYDVKNKPQ